MNSHLPKLNINYLKKVSFDDYHPATVEDDFDNTSPYYSIKHISTKPTPINFPSNENLKSILKIKEADKSTILTDKEKLADNTYIPPVNYKQASNYKQRKKSLVEMTDEEILALDEQFKTRKIDFDSFQFENDPLSVPYASADHWATSKLGKTNIKNIDSEITNKQSGQRNSVCLRFKHKDYIDFVQTLENPKYYMCVINSNLESLAAIDYYLHKVSHDGDTLIVSCSVSDDPNIDELAVDLSSLMLEKVSKYNQNLKIELNFEFFRSANYVNDIANLYMPSMVIVGCRSYKKRRSSSLMTNKNYIPVIYVSPEDIDTHPTLRKEVSSDSQDHVTSVGGVTFKSPFADPPRTQTNGCGGSSNVLTVPQKKHSLSSIGSGSSSSSLHSIDSLENDLSHIKNYKTNETEYSTLFEKLHDMPVIQDYMSKQASSSNGGRVTRIKSLVDDLPQSFKTKSHNAFGDSPLTLNKTISATYQPPKSTSSSIIEQYNRRMSIKKEQQEKKKLHSTSNPVVEKTVSPSATRPKLNPAGSNSISIHSNGTDGSSPLPTLTKTTTSGSLKTTKLNKMKTKPIPMTKPETTFTKNKSKPKPKPKSSGSSSSNSSSSSGGSLFKKFLGGSSKKK